MLSGGFFLQPTSISNSDALDAWTVVVLSRVINNVWLGYATHISVKDLSDDAAGSNCAADTLELTLLNTAPMAASTTSTTMIVPAVTSTSFAATTVSSIDQGITPANITKASAQAYCAKGIITGMPDLGTI